MASPWCRWGRWDPDQASGRSRPPTPNWPSADSFRPSSSTDVVDEPLPRNIGAENQAAIPGAEMRLNSCGDAFGYGFRARGNVRPESDLDLLVTVPEAWLASHSRLEETDALGLPIPCPK